MRRGGRLTQIAILKIIKGMLLICALVLALLNSACSQAAPTQTYQPTSTLPNSQTTEPTDTVNPELRNQIEHLALAAKSRVGVAALLETGESVSLNPHDHLPMQTVYRLQILRPYYKTSR